MAVVQKQIDTTFCGDDVTSKSMEFGTDVQQQDRITVSPRIMVGKPVIRGTRLTVELILSLL